nr:immunoglobulin light chain junction region [Macaca mulatta]MOX48528.1 immunoglobulin light chain junction region [Macaca mulatta]MOX48677.1 immunoglobulin light chain junction region [Macaca mulatta]MOX48742.1 immunoglobulin light chain junction region [Macaca mulatta]MOX49140.1 immunoglobulin light chain junction region [Macaca mulatta]
CQKYLTFPFTF